MVLHRKGMTADRGRGPCVATESASEAASQPTSIRPSSIRSGGLAGTRGVGASIAGAGGRAAGSEEADPARSAIRKRRAGRPEASRCQRSTASGAWPGSNRAASSASSGSRWTRASNRDSKPARGRVSTRRASSVCPAMTSADRGEGRRLDRRRTSSSTSSGARCASSRASATGRPSASAVRNRSARASRAEPSDPGGRREPRARAIDRRRSPGVIPGAASTTAQARGSSAIKRRISRVLPTPGAPVTSTGPPRRRPSRQADRAAARLGNSGVDRSAGSIGPAFRSIAIPSDAAILRTLDLSGGSPGGLRFSATAAPTPGRIAASGGPGGPAGIDRLPPGAMSA